MGVSGGLPATENTNRRQKMSATKKTTAGLIPSNKLNALASKVKSAVELAGKSMKETLRRHRDVGKLLLEARRLCDEEQIPWGWYCPNKCGMTQQHAGRLTAIAS